MTHVVLHANCHHTTSQHWLFEVDTDLWVSSFLLFHYNIKLYLYWFSVIGVPMPSPIYHQWKITRTVNTILSYPTILWCRSEVCWSLSHKTAKSRICRNWWYYSYSRWWPFVSYGVLIMEALHHKRHQLRKEQHFLSPLENQQLEEWLLIGSLARFLPIYEP